MTAIKPVSKPILGQQLHCGDAEKEIWAGRRILEILGKKEKLGPREANLLQEVVSVLKNHLDNRNFSQDLLRDFCSSSEPIQMLFSSGSDEAYCLILALLGNYWFPFSVDLSETAYLLTSNIGKALKTENGNFLIHYYASEFRQLPDIVQALIGEDSEEAYSFLLDLMQHRNTSSKEAISKVVAENAGKLVESKLEAAKNLIDSARQLLKWRECPELVSLIDKARAVKAAGPVVAAEEGTCSNCGASNKADMAECETCGAHLSYDAD